MAESTTELVETVQVVQEKVTQLRWVIDDFSKAMFPDSEDSLSSGEIKLNDGSGMSFGLYLYCPSGLGDNSFLLVFYQCGFGDKEAMDVRCKFWIENSNGDKYGETTERQHTFIRDFDDNGIDIEDFLNRKDLVKDFAFNDGHVTICAEVCYWSSAEECVQPNPDLELRQKLWTAYQQGLTDDFTIQVEGKEIKVSKNILAANSDVFERMLLTANSKEAQTGTIKIEEASFDIMKAFVEYLCRGQVGNLSQICEDLFILSRRYMIAQLQIDCSEEMAKSLNKDNVVGRLKLAFLHDDDTLKNATIAYITSSSSDLNFGQILDSTEWMQFAVENTALAQEITKAAFSKVKVFRKQ